MTATKIENVTEDFDWIQLSKDIKISNETFIEKLTRKVAENPFVPVGALGAAGALSYGLWSMKTGDPRMQQIMMRTRIGAQGFCVASLIIGLIFANK